MKNSLILILENYFYLHDQIVNCTMSEKPTSWPNICFLNSCLVGPIKFEYSWTIKNLFQFVLLSKKTTYWIDNKHRLYCIAALRLSEVQCLVCDGGDEFYAPSTCLHQNSCSLLWIWTQRKLMSNFQLDPPNVMTSLVQNLE